LTANVDEIMQSGMREPVNRSRREASIATFIGNAINLLVVSIQAVVLIPLYLQAIGPRLYGAWLGSGDILIWMQALDFGIPNLMIQRIGAAHGRNDSSAVGHYFATGALALGLVAMVLCAGGIALSFALPQWMGLHGLEAQTLQSCFAIGVVASALNVFMNSVVGYSRGVQDTVAMNAVQVASSIAGFAVSLILLAINQGLWAIALGLLVRSLVFSIGSLVFVASAIRSGLAPC
jgi:hypothetical protein